MSLTNAKELLGFMHFLFRCRLSLPNKYALEHGCYHGLGMDALVKVCSHAIMVWAWMLW